MAELQVSAGNLAQLAAGRFCPRCFWLKMRLQNKLPWSRFPGIFASIDSYSKKVGQLHWSRHGSVPPWMRGWDLLEPVPVPHWSKFFVQDEATGIRLTGVPDVIFRRADASHFIADYKTAKFTAHQEEILPMYHVQLNAYAYIAHRRGFSPVTGIGLVYYQPRNGLTEERLPSILLDDGFQLLFAAKVLSLELEPERLIPPLLRQARQIVDLEKPPEGRQGCEDCQRVEALMRIFRLP